MSNEDKADDAADKDEVFSKYNKKDDKDELWRQMAGAGESVIAIGLLAGLGAWGGTTLDQRFHTTPWLAICLSMLGLVLGFVRMIMKVLKSEKK